MKRIGIPLIVLILILLICALLVFIALIPKIQDWRFARFEEQCQAYLDQNCPGAVIDVIMCNVDGVLTCSCYDPEDEKYGFSLRKDENGEIVKGNRYERHTRATDQVVTSSGE